MAGASRMNIATKVTASADKINPVTRSNIRSNVQSQHEKHDVVSQKIGSDDGLRGVAVHSQADSVLGDTNRDILLKAVIQKVEFNSKRLDDVNARLTGDIANNYQDQQKTLDHLMDANDGVTEMIHQVERSTNRKLESSDQTLVIIRDNMRLLEGLLELGRVPGTSLMDQL